MIKKLQDNCALLYADLLQKSLDSRYVLLNGGSFVFKKINNSKYWYHQTKSPNGTNQRYLGKESDELLEKIEIAKKERELSYPIIEVRRRLVAMLGVGGAFLEKGRSSKILERMADVGLFLAGGVLVGSFAFSCYGNMLGVSLNKQLMRTEDMDFSVERGLEIGFHRSILNDLITVDPTFKIPRQINPWVPSLDLIASDGFKIEFLTTKENAADKGAVYIERFSLYAQPLDYMDYLLGQVQPAVILSGAGIPVTIPDPARYAMHKLAISQLRSVAFQTKITKDIEQAGSILEVLLEDNPGSIILASDALKKRSDLMIDFVIKGIKRLPKEIQSKLLDVVTFPDIRWYTKTGLNVIDVESTKLD